MTLTTAEAARLANMGPAAFRREMSRARTKGTDLRVPGPDERTPHWDAARLTAWLDARPGRGNWRKGGVE